ncbi:hypothetical protein K8S19_04625 [bacterium]|nr:hypothetical protein [bacterium]
MIYSTIVCANYLPRAKVLAASIKQHDPKAKFCLCIVEKEMPEGVGNYPHFDRVVLAKDLGFGYFNRFIIKHELVEGATAVKAQWMKYLFATFKTETNSVYLDPDIMLYSPLPELRFLLVRHAIVLTPHLLTPGNLEMEMSCMNHGIYNLGFLALRRSPEAKRFLNWWHDRICHACYIDKERGIFTDQKWVDLAPTLFDVHLLKHPGYNIAIWNISGRHLKIEKKRLTVNGHPVRFIHFSDIGKKIFDWAIENWGQASLGVMKKLSSAYRDKLEENRNTQLIPWSYDYLDNGETVTREIRVIFRNEGIMPEADPYRLTMKRLNKLWLLRKRLKYKAIRIMNKVLRKLDMHI